MIEVDRPEPSGPPPARQVRHHRRRRGGTGGAVGPRPGWPRPPMATWKRSGCCWIAYRSGRDARIKCLNQLRHLGFTAPDELRERFRGVTVAPSPCLRRGAAPEPQRRPPVTYATKLAMHTLGRRVLDIDADCARLHGELTDLVRATAPSLLEPLRRRRPHRRPAARRRRRQRRTDHLRGRLRPPLRCRPDPRLVRQDDPPPAQPGRQPPSQPRPVAHRVHPHGLRPAHPRLRRTPHSPKDAPSPRSCASSSATSPARSTATSPALSATIGAAGLAPNAPTPPAVLRTICRPAAPPSPATPLGLIRACPLTRVAHHWSATLVPN